MPKAVDLLKGIAIQLYTLLHQHLMFLFISFLVKICNSSDMNYVVIGLGQSLD